MRGKPTLNDGWNEYGRITPAHAGKTLLAIADVNGVEDHPRACGENNLCYNRFNIVIRITPAHAGKTSM